MFEVETFTKLEFEKEKTWSKFSRIMVTFIEITV